MRRILFTSLLIATFSSMIFGFSGSEVDRKPEEWILIHKDKQSIYIDKESVKRSERIPKRDIFRVWGKIVYEDPKPYKSKHIKDSLRYYEWFCNDKMFRVLQEINIFTDGTSELRFTDRTIGFRENLEIRDWKKVNPNMPENVIYKHICK
jgi:hypothetical protein